MTKIQYLRNEQQLNRSELARRANISDSVIHRIEKGQTYANVPIGTFYKIAKALNVDLIDVIDFDRLEEK